MSFLKPFSTLRVAAIRSSIPSRSTLPAASRRFASGDYGSGTGDPAGENPQDQGPSTSSDLEHPGPPPPSAGQGTGTTPTKGTAKGHNTDGKSQSDSDNSHEVKGAQPKILNANPPENLSEDVKQHNREMDQRAEKADTKVSNEDAEKDKVHPKFWSGHGGADRDP